MSWFDKDWHQITGRGLRADAGKVGRVPDELTQGCIGDCDLSELELDFGQPWPEGSITAHNRKRRGRRGK